MVDFEVYMNTMVRKTFYITPRQDALLKQLAQLRGVSEAEIVRQAIDQEIERSEPFVAQDDHSAWEELLRLFEKRTELGITGEPYRWNRQELYEERESRWLRNRSQD
jgi:hypothetical protein